MPLILVIEDEQSIRANLLKILKFNGFESVGAEDGESGVRLARQYSPDLIICDIMMPGIDGYAVLETLTQDLETATIPFIFLSAKSDRADVRQGMSLGADDYLTKPFSDMELVQAIHARLKKQESIRQPALNAVKQAVGKLNELAYYDPLTQLPNRILLRQKLDEILTQASKQQVLIVVFCIQIYRYKNISITFDYSTTDLLLQAIAQRLTDWIKPTDFVARLNESEFCVVLVRYLQQESVNSWAEALLNKLSIPYTIEDQKIRVSFNIGIAVFSKDCSSSDQILSQANLAMRSQAQKINSYQFYSSEMGVRSVERKLLETSLHQALQRSEFELYYQPQVNLVTGRIIGAEALLRWHHPNLGLVAPDVFISLAEELGLMVSIGEWVLQTACAEAQIWQMIHQPPIRVAVNLSSQQIKQLTFLEQVTQILNHTQLSPELLEIEITETGMLDNIEAIKTSFQQLKTVGIQISIDDFGTGYSSLAYLKHFPVDTLKIDRLFINDILIDGGNASIVIAIIAMAHSLKLKVVAEGVENHKQLDFLRQHGCHAMQGFLFKPALPAYQFRKVLAADLRLSRIKA